MDCILSPHTNNKLKSKTATCIMRCLYHDCTIINLYVLCHYGSSILHIIIPNLVHVVCNINHSRFNLCPLENICLICALWRTYAIDRHDTCFTECSVLTMHCLLYCAVLTSVCLSLLHLCSSSFHYKKLAVVS